MQATILRGGLAPGLRRTPPNILPFCKYLIDYEVAGKRRACYHEGLLRRGLLIILGTCKACVLGPRTVLSCEARIRDREPTAVSMSWLSAKWVPYSYIMASYIPV